MGSVPRIVLIVNPFATGVTRTRVADVATALERYAEVAIEQTEGPGHAGKLAAQAAVEADAIVLFSGDGTYNEAINGAGGLVPFGFIPGGGTSVFPRALGLPRQPVAAAIRVAEALLAGRTRSIALGRVNGRRFCFSAGIGFDAEAVRRIDRRGRDLQGRRASNFIYTAVVIGLIFESRLRMPARLEVDGYGRAAFILVANGHPYTYAGPIPVSIVGTAEFGAGLDFVAPTLVPTSVPAFAIRMFRGTLGNDRHVLSGHDLDTIRVRCDRPLPLQADGEDLGDVTEALFEAERDALTVLV